MRWNAILGASIFNNTNAEDHRGADFNLKLNSEPTQEDCSTPVLPIHQAAVVGNLDGILTTKATKPDGRDNFQYLTKIERPVVLISQQPLCRQLRGYQHQLLLHQAASSSKDKKAIASSLVLLSGDRLHFTE